MKKTFGRVTLPGESNFLEETKDLLERWGADAIRDSDGTKLDEGIRNLDAKIYTTYFVARGHNEFAEQHMEECQQIYLMSAYTLAAGEDVRIAFAAEYFDQQVTPDYDHDPKQWWEVIDRTSGAVVAADDWELDQKHHTVIVHHAQPFHEYTVSFLAYILWDPTQMYNHITNDWGDKPHEIPFDVRKPFSSGYVVEYLKHWLQEEENKRCDIVRFTTFFYHFTLIFNNYAKEKFVDWCGYGASVSTEAILAFEQEKGYRLRPEVFIQNGYYNSTFCVPTKEYRDYIDFTQRFVSERAKELVDLVHEAGKEAMMFLGDNWIGTEPYGAYFPSIGLDAVVGSVGGGATLRLISDIPGVKYHEGRFLPYFFPDTFHEGGDPVKEAKVNWVTARRAILRKPIDRIGYGGYLKLAMQFPDFIDYVESVCQEFRTLYNNIKGTTPYCVKRVAVLNSWGKMRAWGNHMVHHAIYYKQNYSYAGIIEALSGAPFDVKFISFDDIRENPDILKDIDVILNVGGAYTAYSGGENWADEKILTAVKRFVYEGGGFIGVGEPTACQREGRYFQLSGVMGVEKENGFTLNVDKYNWEEHEHFITEDCRGDVDFGEGQKSIFAFPETTIIKQTYKEVQLAANDFGDGRSVYISGLPYSFENSRLLYRAILWSSHDEENLHKWFSENYNVEVHAYVKNGKYCVVNNTYEPQDTVVYKGDGSSFALHLEANEIIWYEI